MTTRTSLSVDKLLQKLIVDESSPSIQELGALSDLSIPDWQRVRGLWSAIPEKRRWQTVKDLVEASYADLQLELGRFLRVAIEDESERVRSMAIHGLGEDVGEDLISPLIQILNYDPSATVRAVAAAALGAFVLAGELEEIDSIQAMRAEEALLAILHSETEALEVQCRALESVAFSGEAGIRQLIEDAYYSPYEEMQISSLVAMGRSADTRWRATAQSELENSSPLVRTEAARACGELEARAALEDLMSLLTDEEKSVRLAAIFALGRLGGRDAEDALNSMLLSEDEDEVEAAEEALEDVVFFGDADEIPLFDESETDFDEDDDDW
ncbi:MAG: HEAT repeat domain-containing protein [Caldilineaceae bacterium]|nr:HEAT repeat domain-containing protein [Caldilineaceae bacterium]